MSTIGFGVDKMGAWTNKVCVITDAVSAVGRETAWLLAKKGARLVLLAQEDADVAAFQLDEIQHACICRIERVDQCNQEALEELVGHLEKDPEFGAPNALFYNSVPPFTRQRILGMPAEMVDRLIQRDITSLFLSVKVFGAAMARGGNGGSIVLLGSIHDDKPTGIAPLLSMYMGALKNLSREAALFFGYDSVRTNVIEMGASGEEDKRFQNDLSSFYEGYLYKIPSGYVGGPEDVAALTAYLLSDDARYVNGAEVRMDGGLTLHYIDAIANYKAYERRERHGTVV